MELTINSRRLTKMLLLCLSILFVVNVIMMVVTDLKYRGVLINHLFHKFYFDSKSNFPSYFNTLLLLLATGLLYYIHLAYARKYSREIKWLLFAFLFFVIALEENIPIHVFLGTFQPDYIWLVIAISIVLALFTVYFGRLLFLIPRRIAAGFLACGAVYITGAIVLDVVGAKIEGRIGQWNYMYAGIATVEETLEMLSIIMFVGYLLEYIKTEFPTGNFKVV